MAQCWGIKSHYAKLIHRSVSASCLESHPMQFAVPICKAILILVREPRFLPSYLGQHRILEPSPGSYAGSSLHLKTVLLFSPQGLKTPHALYNVVHCPSPFSIKHVSKNPAIPSKSSSVVTFEISRTVSTIITAQAQRKSALTLIWPYNDYSADIGINLILLVCMAVASVVVLVVDVDFMKICYR